MLLEHSNQLNKVLKSDYLSQYVRIMGELCALLYGRHSPFCLREIFLNQILKLINKAVIGRCTHMLRLKTCPGLLGC